MKDYKDILYGVKDSVATITINRPDSLNAFTGDTIDEMIDAIKIATDDRDVGVLVLTGVGERAFCVGGDVKWEADGGLDGLDFPINQMIIRCPKPVIARVNGYSIGGGNHLAYYCDLTIAADHAIFGQNGPRVGSPASGFIVGYLANVVGHKRAREMWMGLRKYTAAEMLNWGLVNAVVPYAELDEEVSRWANDMLALSPTCLRLIKQTFYDNVDYMMDQTMKKVLTEHAPNYFETGEQQEGANAFLEKRAPDFSPWR
ncbi:MAG: 1,4-dihydroxy-6-naphthoate synthase [Gammaproteobacteria bacterium]|nr:MAG: 1,4-dihydroxy-6-naphthoate synthase [Gammaproteobacteria bacterium]RLA48813.1 MAG: 1,4-dihydroxy-6-naphthoate synthase [Gammaproteobacteria bacterium]